MKTVVITGAGAGLGRALAKGFAEEGNRVVLLGRTGAKVEKVAGEIGDNALAITCDIGSPESVRQTFARIGEETSVIDVLINNAGVYEPYFVKDATDEQISGAIQANLAGPIYCCRAASPLMALSDYQYQQRDGGPAPCHVRALSEQQGGTGTVR